MNERTKDKLYTVLLIIAIFSMIVGKLGFGIICIIIAALLNKED